jgi:hypothetical protein
VLVAFSLLAVALSVLYSIFGFSLTQAERSGNKLRALMLAESVRDAVEIDPAVRLPRASGDEVGCHWRVDQIASTSVETQARTNLVEFAVTAECGTLPRHGSVSIRASTRQGRHAGP